MKDCRVLPLEHDIMGMRGTYHKARVQELVENFKVWRDERLPGTRAFLSKYDRVGVIEDSNLSDNVSGLLVFGGALTPAGIGMLPPS